MTLIPYTVQPKDTLWTVAKRFDTTTADLIAWNVDKLNKKRIEESKKAYAELGLYNKMYKDDEDWMWLLKDEVIYVPVWEKVNSQ